MDLDEETLELLGYGTARMENALRDRNKYSSKRHAQLREAWLRYSRTPKGKAAVARRVAKQKASGYAKQYYAKNREREKERARLYRLKMKNDPEYKRKANKRGSESYYRRKAQRELQGAVSSEANQGAGAASGAHDASAGDRDHRP